MKHSAKQKNDPSIETARKRAKEKVLTELINALLYEDFLRLRDAGEVGKDLLHIGEIPLDDDEYWLLHSINQEQTVAFRVRRKPRFKSYELSRLPVLLIGNKGEERRELDPDELMRLLHRSVSLDMFPNMEGFCEELNLSVEQHVLSFEEPVQLKQGPDVSLAEGERFAALRDRPFHPTSRVKNGWDGTEYRLYSPEFGRSFGLDWVAVHKTYICKGNPPVDDLPQLLLSPAECETLRRSADKIGVTLEEFFWIPVHPWQMKSVIPKVFERELKEQIIVPFAFNLGEYIPGSSVRSLIPAHHRRIHVKVPIGIYSLGALRIMPPRYLQNGVIGQELVTGLKSREPALSERLLICDETKWVTFFDPDGDPFADKPGHLGCLIRQYPEEIEKADAAFPMSALSVYSMEGTSPLIQRLLEQRNSTDGKSLFGEISRSFINMAFLFAKYGVLPELHGQNVVLLFQGGKLRHLLLRDHDTVRIYPEWMKRANVDAVSYTVKPNTRNTLVLSSPEDLLSYLQTLAIQVNLASVMEAFVKGGYLSENEGWSLIEEMVRQAIADFVPAEIKREMIRILLEEDHWPVKEIIAPLLKRKGSGGGSMPSGQGRIANPLRWELDE